MPKKRESAGRGVFELAGYWIDRESGRPSWYRYWYDSRTGRVRRRSLGVEDLEEAKIRLASLVASRPAPEQQHGSELPGPRQVLLVAVLDHYLEHRAKDLPSRGAAERACQLLVAWLFDVRGMPKTIKADALGLDLQEEFVRWCATQHGHSSKYISRVLSVISAALRYAADEQPVDDPDDGRRIVRLMSHAPKVRYDPGWIAETAKIAAPQRRSWVPTIDELARFLDQVRAEHAFRYCILALNTWGRAEAIMELDLRRQLDRDSGLLDLNPPGRRQTLKRRPIIRATRNLLAWTAEWNMARPLEYHGQVVVNVKKAIQAANARWMMTEAGMRQSEIEKLMRAKYLRERTKAIQQLEANGSQRITRRVIRSFMGTRVRGLRELRVEREQRQVWLGHQSQDTTSMYEILDPDYLREAADATDMIIDRIDAAAQRSLWPEKVQPMLPLVARNET